MLARDVMSSPVITVKPGSSVKDVAKILINNRISAVPVVDEANRLVGIITEGDLSRRVEAGTERERPRWLAAFAAEEPLADEYVKAHASKVSDVMSKAVITAAPDTPLDKIVALFEGHAIKSVPITENGDLVGIVNRASLLLALTADQPSVDLRIADGALRDSLLEQLKGQPWVHMSLLDVTVRDGIVDLSGVALSQSEKNAIRAAAESTPGVRAVNDKLVVRCW